MRIWRAGLLMGGTKRWTLVLLLVASCVDSPDTLPSTTSTSTPTTTSTSVAEFEWPVVAGHESMHWPSGPVSGVPVSFPDPMYCECSLVTLDDGRVLMAGSGYGIGYAARIWDPDTREWTETGAPNTEWNGFTPGLQMMDDGRVLAAMPGHLEIYDPTVGSFSQLDMPASVGSLDDSFSGVATPALMADGRVFLATSTTSGVVFDPVSEAFEASGAPRGTGSTGDVTAAVPLNDGRVLILSYMTASVYDPVTELFERLDPVLPLQWGLAAAPLPDGRVLITGGESWVSECDCNLGLADVQIFDPSTNRFEGARFMLEPRSHHSALALPDGRVAIIGGAAGRVELFDPEAGLFVQAPELSRPRDRSAIAVLDDGSLLVAGGNDDGAVTLDGFNLDTTTSRTAEIYHPQLGSIEHSVAGLSGITLRLEPEVPWNDTARRSLWLRLDIPPGALDGIANARALWELKDPAYDGPTVVLWKDLDDRQWGFVGNDPVERPLPTDCDEGCVIREEISHELEPSTLRGLYFHISYEGEIPDEAAQIKMTIVDE